MTLAVANLINSSDGRGFWDASANDRISGLQLPTAKPENRPVLCPIQVYPIGAHIDSPGPAFSAGHDAARMASFGRTVPWALKPAGRQRVQGKREKRGQEPCSKVQHTALRDAFRAYGDSEPIRRQPALFDAGSVQWPQGGSPGVGRSISGAFGM